MELTNQITEEDFMKQLEKKEIVATSQGIILQLNTSNCYNGSYVHSLSNVRNCLEFLLPQSRSPAVPENIYYFRDLKKWNYFWFKDLESKLYELVSKGVIDWSVF